MRLSKLSACALALALAGCGTEGLNQLPVTLVAKANDVQSLAGAPVSFDGSASTPATDIVSWNWSFGDGASATGAQVSHSYASAGTYAVKLTVADEKSDASATVQAVISAPQPQNEPPVAAIAASPTTAGVAAPIAFDGSGSHDPDGTIASYAWDFGDGASATGATASHAYGAAGNFTARLTVTDNGGLTDSATASLTVQAAADAPIFPSTYSYGLTTPSQASECGGFEAAALQFKDTNPSAASSTLTIVEGSGGGVSGATYTGTYTSATRAFTATSSGGGSTQTLAGTFAPDFKSFTGSYIVDVVFICDPAVSRAINGTRTSPP